MSAKMILDAANRNIAAVVIPVNFRTVPRYVTEKDEAGNDVTVENLRAGVAYETHKFDEDANAWVAIDPENKVKGQEAVKRAAVEITEYYPTLESFGIDAPYTLSARGVVYADKALQVLQDAIEATVHAEARAILEDYRVPTAEELDFWKIANTEKSKRASSKAAALKLTREMVTAAAESFEKAMQALGRNPTGVEIMVGILKRRCKDVITMDKAKLEAIKANISAWFVDLSEDEQTEHAVFMQFTLGKFDEALSSDGDIFA